MKKRRIILTVTNNLESDQRVHRIATHFHEREWEVLVVGSQNKTCHSYEQAYSTCRLPVFFKKGFLFYAEFNLRLFFFLLFSRFDRVWANDTDTVLPAFLTCKIRRKQLTLDLHELFPEVPELAERPRVKKCWEAIETLIFPHITDGYTVCSSIATHYRERYGMNLKVLRNVPFRKEYKGKGAKFTEYGKKIILYQGAVNDGRGIEWIIDAMPYIDNAIFVVIGKGDLSDQLERYVSEQGLEEKVEFLGHIPFAQLEEYTCSADLGVCLLKQKGLSYYYALPNRTFDFMQAHVPLLATDFPEIAKVVGEAKTGVVINHYEPKYLANIIQEILRQPIDHEVYRKAAEENVWEKEELIIDQQPTSTL